MGMGWLGVLWKIGEGHPSKLWIGIISASGNINSVAVNFFSVAFLLLLFDKNCLLIKKVPFLR